MPITLADPAHFQAEPQKLTPKRLAALNALVDALVEQAEEVTTHISDVDTTVEDLAVATTRDDRATLRAQRDAERDALAEEITALYNRVLEVLDAIGASAATA
jgi:hypothetical protein